jgi:hypothetical protein
MARRARNDLRVALDIRSREQRSAEFESSTSRNLMELEQIARGVAAADPWARRPDGGVRCTLCDGRPDDHAEYCAWVSSKAWVRRNLP